jgi:hypothetical protein
MKTLIIIGICVVVLFFIIKKRNGNKLKNELLKYRNTNENNINEYIKTLENKTITNSDITKLSNLIHTFLSSDWLYNNQIRGGFKGAKAMLDASPFEQAKMITEMNSHFTSVIGDRTNTFYELNEEKDKGIRLASQKMNVIFENL